MRTTVAEVNARLDNERERVIQLRDDTSKLRKIVADLANEKAALHDRVIALESEVERLDKLRELQPKVRSELEEKIERTMKDGNATAGHLQVLAQKVELLEQTITGLVDERGKDHNMLLGVRNIAHDLVNQIGVHKSHLDRLDGTVAGIADQSSKFFGRIECEIEEIYERLFPVTWRDRLTIWLYRLRYRGGDDE